MLAIDFYAARVEHADSEFRQEEGPTFRWARCLVPLA